MNEHSPDESGNRELFDAPRFRWSLYALILAGAAGLFLANLLNAQPLRSANDRSRWCTIWSLIDRGTYRIDAIIQRPGWDTIDKVRHEGHFYSSKPALLPTLIAGVTWTVEQTTGWDLLRNTEEVTRLTLLVVNWLPMLAALVVLILMVERYAQTNWARVTIVLTAALGTLLIPFLSVLNNHTVAAYSVLFALYPAMRIVVDGKNHPLYFILCGFWAAFVPCNELPAALFGLAMFGLLFRHAPKPTLMFFVPAALIPLAGFFYTTWLATGGWKPFYLYYGTEKYLYVHEGVPSYWMQPRGLDRSIDSPFVYFLHCTIGHHGIFSLTPVYLLTLVSWLSIRRWSEHKLRIFFWIGLLLTGVILTFYLTRTQNYNYGGVSIGLRWMLWLIPFWLIALIPVLDQWGSRRWFQTVTAVLLSVSVFSAMYPQGNPWQQPWLFQLMENWNWIDYRQSPPPFERPLQTWFPRLPPIENANDRHWIEFAAPSTEGNGGTVRLRLSDLGLEERNGQKLRKIQLRWSQKEETTETNTYFIDSEAFQKGLRPEKFLRWPEGEPDPEQKKAARQLLQGLPRYRPYNNGLIRYLKTPLRRDAFRCQRAASQVYYRPEGDEQTLLYRRDLWLCPDVPFGVLQMVITISEPETGWILSRRRFVAVDASEIFSKQSNQTERKNSPSTSQ